MEPRAVPSDRKIAHRTCAIQQAHSVRLSQPDGMCSSVAHGPSQSGCVTIRAVMGFGVRLSFAERMLRPMLWLAAVLLGLPEVALADDSERWPAPFGGYFNATFTGTS